MRGGKSTPFYEEPKFTVPNPKFIHGTIPEYIIKADFGLHVAIYLASEGYYQGNPELVLNSPVSLVLDTYNYSLFKRDLKSTVDFLAYQEREHNG